MAMNFSIRIAAGEREPAAALPAGAGQLRREPDSNRVILPRNTQKCFALFWLCFKQNQERGGRSPHQASPD
jgi:hypothetical protein